MGTIRFEIKSSKHKSLNKKQAITEDMLVMARIITVNGTRLFVNKIYYFLPQPHAIGL